MAAYSVFGDGLLLRTLSWDEVEVIYHLLLEPAPRRNLRERGLLHMGRLDPGEFLHMFRFNKVDYRKLLASLMIPEEFITPQRVRVPGDEAFGMTLRRLAYPNRLCDLELVFSRHSSVISSVVSSVLAHIEYHFDHLLANMTTHKWLDLTSIKRFSEVRMELK